jgi:hypothetical protein
MLKYTVYVGGAEVNDYYLSKDEAWELADEWELDGYNDVEVAEVEIDNETPAETNEWLRSGGW